MDYCAYFRSRSRTLSMHIIQNASALLTFLAKMNTFNILNEREQLGLNALRIQITHLEMSVFSLTFTRVAGRVGVSIERKKINRKYSMQIDCM